MPLIHNPLRILCQPTLCPPVSTIPLPEALCRNEQETTLATRLNRQSGNEVLGLPARSRFGEGRAETAF